MFADNVDGGLKLQICAWWQPSPQGHDGGGGGQAQREGMRLKRKKCVSLFHSVWIKTIIYHKTKKIDYLDLHGIVDRVLASLLVSLSKYTIFDTYPHELTVVSLSLEFRKLIIKKCQEILIVVACWICMVDTCCRQNQHSRSPGQTWNSQHVSDRLWNGFDNLACNDRISCWDFKESLEEQSTRMKS